MSEPEATPTPSNTDGTGDSPADDQVEPETKQTPPEQAPARQADRPQPEQQAPSQPQPAQHAPSQMQPPPHHQQQLAHHPYTGPVLVGPPPALPYAQALRWQRAESGTPPWILLVAIAAALFGGWSAFHPEGVGIGLAATGIALIGVPLAAGGREDLVTRLPGAVIVAALWSVAAIRDAGWIVALCAIAALLLTPLALAPQRRFTGTAFALFAHLEGLAGSFKWARRSRSRKAVNTVRNLRVFGLTAALLVVFGGLFAAADASFANLVSGLLPRANPIDVFLRLLLASVLLVVVLLWSYLAAARPSFEPDEPFTTKPASRFELAVPLGALNLLFLAFIVMQARVLFGGDEYVQRTANLTMAEYARSGFWQLSFVAVLALIVIAVAAWKAPRRERGDRWVTRILLGGLCILSLAVVASALFRMSRYWESFGLTRLRLWVFTVEIWLAILFALVLFACWKLRAKWLPQAVLASGALTLIGLAAVNPDGVVARYNIDRFEDSGNLDLDYLETLSADAVPEIMELDDDNRECVLRWRESDWPERPLMAWNWGDSHGRELAFDYRIVPADDQPSCPSHLGTDFEENSRDDEYGAPELDGLDDATASEPEFETETEPVTPASSFFHWDTCDELDLTGADEMFGTSAKGDYGTVPDEANHNGASVGPNLAGEEVEGWLTCGYFGPGTRYLYLEVEQWDTWETEAGQLDAKRVANEGYGYEVTDLGSETMDGFIAVADNSFDYMFALDNVTFEATITDGPTGDEAELVCQKLTNHLAEMYLELA
ncbi:DUF4153 domain-containing protein [Glycomyces buryatensis]|uniref:DUF4173 domain-containing protein n=1 Tax=Glycomyces buryatensis TaxID=2570927 RepID=A0A4S8QDT6_9ACTN|nr:DUF4153 domain-containing protein [Glycomyces buryatensis]THV38674.1 DUF4173 domain-containing protein [Glycomyces buryatensis]